MRNPTPHAAQYTTTRTTTTTKRPSLNLKKAERAKLTRQLAQIKEADGDIDGATDAMLDVYVETFGALSKREKIDFILEQVRLTILKGDWVRVLIVAKKVQKKFLEEPEMEDLKLRFYGLMVRSFVQFFYG